jgi:N-methylhydantoinase A
VGRLAGELGLGTVECAEGIVRVASTEMARALRVVSVERGVDPRDYALVAFGGAGPMHATAVADELSMDRILCPPTSGVLAALGLVVSERRRDAQRSVLLSGASLDADAVAEVFGELADRARAALDEPVAGMRAVYALRYRGQAFELPVEVEGESPAEPGALRGAFAAAHEERYGYVEPEGEVELVTVRVTATAPGPELELSPPPDAGGQEPAARRSAVFGGEEIETAVWEGPPAPGARVVGPAVCELPESTVVVAPGWEGSVDPTGALALRRA